ncbi:MAG: CHAT domain-containing protein [Planctomycetota bacterium]
MLAPNAAWKQTARQIYEKLQLNQISGLVGSAKRIVIVPHDRLWYLPFELLPLAGQPDDTWLASKSITYVPTLGAIDVAYGIPKVSRDTAGVIGKVFSNDSKKNKEVAKSVLDAVPNSSGIYLTEQVTVPNEKWLRLRSDQLWIAAQPTKAPSVWDQSLIAFPKLKQSSLGNWLETPLASPTSVVAAGLTSSVKGPAIGNGNDLFLPACAMLMTGSRSVVLSRWPVGGRSAGILLRRYLEERESSASSTAWRRATLALWPEDFLIADEPALLPAGDASDAIVTGSHPVLWASYMHLGDQLVPPAVQPAAQP